MSEITIGKRQVGDNHPTYFIADIAANHDGSLERAKSLIRLAKEAGADAAKFQNFRAEHIVSDHGFQSMGSQMSHQKSWKKSVFSVYQEASIPFEWTPRLKQACDEAGIEYFSSPYDHEAVDMLESYVPAYKIGSGDINWIEALEYMAEKGKPILLATGASNIGEVQQAMQAIMRLNTQVVLMQCNTNYTAQDQNFDHIHLNVLQTYHVMFPTAVLGLSDHTLGPVTVLGAVALGARVIEKHFTDRRDRLGPDHAFSMTPEEWHEMVVLTRELERSLGSTQKFVAANESDTVMVQRRCIRAARNIPAGQRLARSDLALLRPAPKGSMAPQEIESVLLRQVRRPLVAGEAVQWIDLE